MDEQTADEPRVIPTAHQVTTICRPRSDAVRAWHGLERLGARLDRQLDAELREHRLTRAQLSLLLAVGASEGLTQQELATDLGLTKANISQVLDRLQGAGLVARVPLGRAYALHLTEAGRGVIAAVMPGQIRLIEDAFAALPSADLRRLSAMVERLADGDAAGDAVTSGTGTGTGTE